LDVDVFLVKMYWPPVNSTPGRAQVVYALHIRSDTFVRAADSYCEGVQVVADSQTRLLCEVGAVFSYCVA
jgi:hypothetical protein